jgi:hypothetical protein
MQGYGQKTVKARYDTVKNAPNTACTRLGVGPAFLSMFLACAGFRFEGESTLPPQAGNASRWAALSAISEKAIAYLLAIC